MIEQTDDRLKEWIASVVGDVEVDFGVPSANSGSPCVELYLLELRDNPPPRTTARAPHRITLRYLVSTRAAEPRAAHQLLGQLLAAALEHGEFDTVVVPLSAGDWTALGAVPRPSFCLAVQLRIDRPEPTTRLVTEELEINAAPVVSLVGCVLGPGEIPLVEARVELPGSRKVAYTDHRGRFRFTTVPATPRERRIDVRAKGHHVHVTSAAGTADDDPLIIHFDPFPDLKHS